MAEDIIVRAVGPAATGGKLPLSELARLAGEFQATLERVALVLRGSKASQGRRPRDIVDAVRLDLVGLHEGSAVLELRAADTAIFGHGLLAESMDVLMAGMGAISRRSTEAPAEFTPQIMDGLIRLTGGLSSRVVNRLEITWRDDDYVILDRGFSEHARWLRRQRRNDLVTIVGRLHEGDFDPLALRCRVDTLDATVPCSFGDDLREAVLAAMDCMVVASGVAELQPDGGVRTLALDDLTVINEATRHTAEQIARDQGIGPVQDVSEFATLTDIDDDDFGNFLDGAMSARS